MENSVHVQIFWCLDPHLVSYLIINYPYAKDKYYYMFHVLYTYGIQ
jgi:hypothetical protein